MRGPDPPLGILRGFALKGLFELDTPLASAPLLPAWRALATVAAVSAAASFVALRTSYLLLAEVPTPRAVNLLGHDAAPALTGAVGILASLVVAGGNPPGGGAPLGRHARAPDDRRGPRRRGTPRRRRRASAEDRRPAGATRRAVEPVGTLAERLHRSLGRRRRGGASRRSAPRARHDGPRGGAAPRRARCRAGSSGADRCGFRAGLIGALTAAAVYVIWGADATRRRRARRNAVAGRLERRRARHPRGGRARHRSLVAEPRRRPVRPRHPGRRTLRPRESAVRSDARAGFSSTRRAGRSSGSGPSRASASEAFAIGVPERSGGPRSPRPVDGQPAFALPRDPRRRRPRRRTLLLLLLLAVIRGAGRALFMVDDVDGDGLPGRRRGRRAHRAPRRLSLRLAPDLPGDRDARRHSDGAPPDPPRRTDGAVF